MTEQIEFKITEEGLRLQFQDEDKTNQFIKDMKDHEINFFNKHSDKFCYVIPRGENQPYGLFLSREGRIGLSFASEEQKFYFKERVGIEDSHFMDMGRGYEAQMHFNNENLPCLPGATLMVEHEVIESIPSPG